MLLCEPLTLTLSAADYFTGDAQVGKKITRKNPQCSSSKGAKYTVEVATKDARFM